jgi:biotin operon repressor
MSDTTAVLEKLLTDHVGADNGITQNQLAEALGMGTSTLRSEIRNLRHKEGIPIGNLRNGYFVIQDKDELEEYIGHINREINSKRETIEATASAFGDFEPPEKAEEIMTVEHTCCKCERTVPQDQTKYPKQGPYEGQQVCNSCFGQLVTQGEA